MTGKRCERLSNYLCLYFTVSSIIFDA